MELNPEKGELTTVCFREAAIGSAKGRRARRGALSDERINELRLAYFQQVAKSGSAAARFGVGADRVVEHVHQARRRARARRWFDSLHLDDVALVTSCLDGTAGAWTSLFSEVEPGLIGALDPTHGRTQAIITTRQLLIELRASSSSADRRTMDLRQYWGATSIGEWLCERMIGRIAVADAIHRATVARQHADTLHRVKLAMSLLRRERQNLRRLAAAVAPSPLETGELLREDPVTDRMRLEQKKG